MLETYCTRMELRLKRSFKFQYNQKKKQNVESLTIETENWLSDRTKPSPIAHTPLTDRTFPSPLQHSPLTARTSPHRSQTTLTHLRQLSPISHSPHRSQPTFTDLKPMWIPSLQPYVNPLPPSALPPLRFLLIDRWHTPILARPTSSKFFKIVCFDSCFGVPIFALRFRF